MADPREKQLKKLHIRWDAMIDQRKMLKRDLDQAVLKKQIELATELSSKLDKAIKQESDLANEMAQLRKEIDG